VLARGALPQDLRGRHVVVSAGGTREPLDPVRFLGNRSSGRQGVALASTALARGARVTLVAANLAVPAPAGADVVRVGTAEELARAVLGAAPAADAVVMAAAVADFRPVATAASKIKKDGAGVPQVVLEQTPDVLAALVARRAEGSRTGQVVVGFAAETGDAAGDARAHGRAKLARKGCDLLVVNEVGPAGHPTGFEGSDNAALLLGADGTEVEVPLGSKEALADRVWDAVLARWPA
jgi:phosphopantothenoylcysteine decarboxylase/phosphopantothenate--cysteine ligase